MKKMSTDLFTTINEAIEWIAENRQEGAFCPCCGLIVKEYKRRLNSGMAKELINLYKLCENGIDDAYFHQASFTSRTGGEISKLVHWHLVEEKLKTENDEGKKTSGYWRITEAGKLFVEKQRKVPSHIYLLNNEFMGFESESIDIEESLGKNFSYAELMGE